MSSQLGSLRATADKDSLMALDALLHIRDSLQKEGDQPVPPVVGSAHNAGRNPPKDKRSTVPVPTTTICNIGAPNNLHLHINASSGLFLPLAAPYHPMNSQVVGLQQKAGSRLPGVQFRPSTPTGPFSSSHNNSYAAHQQQQAAAAAATITSTDKPSSLPNAKRPVKAAKPPAGKSSVERPSPPPVADMTSQGEKTSVSKGKRKKETKAIEGIPSSPPPSDTVIRKEKVEAALRSKPQRGRKRNNLSIMERLELTRTRNREHAKTTRIRKKARYQELLDCEQKLQDMSKVEELTSQRRQNIKNFLAIREGMLLHANDPDTPGYFSNSGEQDFKDVGTGSEAKEEVEYPLLLKEAVGSTSDFRFSITNMYNASVSQSIGIDSSLKKMQRWDETLIHQVAETFDAGALRTLVYKLSGGSTGIAISEDGTGFACVDLAVNDKEGGQSILSGILKVQFAAESSRFTSVSWNTVASKLPVVQDRSIADSAKTSPSAESLGSQVVYPSVVSLDPEKSNDSHGIHI